MTDYSYRYSYRCAGSFIIYPSFSHNLAPCESEYLGSDLLLRRWKFHKAALRSLPFIYGNPSSNAAGGSETSLDLPAAYEPREPLPLDVRVSTRPI